MKLEQLETFVTIVETGSINAAAQKLSKTQPAISMTIKRLEEFIGFSLFDRTNYRLKPTEKGLTYYQKSKAILDHLHELSEFTTSVKSGIEHEVAIAIEDTANVSSILSTLQPIQNQFPDTELIIETESRLNSLSRLLNHEVQLAITPWLLTFASEGDFQSKTIKPMSMFYCVHKDLVAPFGVNKSEELNESILRKLPQLLPREFGVNLNQAKIMKPIGRSIVKVNNLTSMLSALHAKLGWGPITDGYWDEIMERHFLRFPIDKMSSPIISEIRIIKNRYATLGPVAEKIWQSF